MLFSVWSKPFRMFLFEPWIPINGTKFLKIRAFANFCYNVPVYHDWVFAFFVSKHLSTGHHTSVHYQVWHCTIVSEVVNTVKPLCKRHLGRKWHCWNRGWTERTLLIEDTLYTRDKNYYPVRVSYKEVTGSIFCHLLSESMCWREQHESFLRSPKYAIFAWQVCIL